MNGMEMMVSSLLKAAGFNPEEIKASIINTMARFETMANDLQNSINQINARLERIEKRLDIAAESEDTSKAISVARREAAEQ